MREFLLFLQPLNSTRGLLTGSARTYSARTHTNKYGGKLRPQTKQHLSHCIYCTLHDHTSGESRLDKYVVFTDKNEYIIEAFDPIEAGYRAISLCEMVDEKLKDVSLITPGDTRPTTRINND